MLVNECPCKSTPVVVKGCRMKPETGDIVESEVLVNGRPEASVPVLMTVSTIGIGEDTWETWR